MNSNTDAILQMDIEGNEYEVLLDFEEVLMKRFRILVIEFHQFYDLTTPFGHKIIQGHCLDMRFSCPVHLRAQQSQKKFQASLIFLFRLFFFTYSTKFGRAAKGARNGAVPTQFEGGLELILGTGGYELEPGQFWGPCAHSPGLKNL